MTAPERRRGKREKDFRGHYVPMVMEWFDVPEFKRLSPMATKIFLAAWFQYDGSNNGNISLHRGIAVAWGCTGERQRTNAVAELLNTGWLIRTRRGGLRMGPDLFAVSVKPIDPCIDRRTGMAKHEMRHGNGYLHLWRPSRAYLRDMVQMRSRKDSHMRNRAQTKQMNDTPVECSTADSCTPVECSKRAAAQSAALRASAVEPLFAAHPALRVSDLYKELPRGAVCRGPLGCCPLPADPDRGAEHRRLGRLAFRP